MRTVEEIIKTQLGGLLMEIAVLTAKIEELEAKVKADQEAKEK